VLEREQVRDGGETQAVPRTFAVRRVVDAAQVEQLLELEGRVVAQGQHRGSIVGGLDHHRHFTECGADHSALAQCGLQGALKDFEFCRHGESAS
jgi:hypothetical protein